MISSPFPNHLPIPQVPLCYSSMLGTHNSGITLADGYGTLDPYFQKYFEWIKWAVSAACPPAQLHCR